jgi:hypothetical protein
MRRFRRRAAFCLAEALGRRQRLVSPVRLEQALRYRARASSSSVV